MNRMLNGKQIKFHEALGRTRNIMHPYMNQFFKSLDKALLSTLNNCGWEIELSKAKARGLFISQETPRVKAFSDAASVFCHASLVSPEVDADQNQGSAETTLRDVKLKHLHNRGRSFVRLLGQSKSSRSRHLREQEP